MNAARNEHIKKTLLFAKKEKKIVILQSIWFNR
jgi:hypothetical protein